MAFICTRKSSSESIFKAQVPSHKAFTGLGLVSKEQDPKDKRRTLLKLTRKGKDLIEKSFNTLYEDMKSFEAEFEE